MFKEVGEQVQAWGSDFKGSITPVAKPNDPENGFLTREEMMAGNQVSVNSLEGMSLSALETEGRAQQ